MLFLPQNISNLLISLKAYLLLPGNPDIFRWSKIIRAFMRGSPRVKDFIKYYFFKSQNKIDE